MPRLDLDAIALDYDRTLTGPSHFEPVPAALDALRRARAAGKRVIIVSGRDVAHLEARLADVADAIVAENGCLLRTREGIVTPVGDSAYDLRSALAHLGVEIEHGRILASADVAHEPLLREALQRAGIRADLIRNVDRVMILPRGVDKAVGLLAACKLLGLDPERVAAAGDGENDIPMLRAAGYAIAVANAVPQLRELADHVTREPGGHGVAQWIEQAWLSPEAKA